MVVLKSLTLHLAALPMVVHSLALLITGNIALHLGSGRRTAAAVTHYCLLLSSAITCATCRKPLIQTNKSYTAPVINYLPSGLSNNYPSHLASTSLVFSENHHY
jgi:hypothetical protein